MEIRRGEAEGVPVLELSGVLDAGSAARVEQAATGLLASGARCLLFDLAGVDEAYPGGLVALVRVHQAAAAAGARLVCAVPRAYLRELLHIIRLDRVIRLAPDLDLALAEVRQWLAAPGRR